MQQIRRLIDFHTYSELVLWPFGYTRRRRTTGMTRDQHDAFAALGHAAWPRTNGYTPEQASDLYIADGAIDDWLWGTNGVFALHVRDVPGAGGAPGFYPPDEAIRRETARNREAVLLLLEERRLPVRGDRQGRQYCPNAPLTTIFAAARPRRSRPRSR